MIRFPTADVNAYSRWKRSEFAADSFLQLIRHESNRVNQEQNVRGRKRGRKKAGFNRRIVGPPNRNSGRNSVEFGVGHEREDAGNEGFSKAVALQLLYSL